MNITREQAKNLSASMFPHINFLVRLRERMEKVALTDPLYRDVCAAYDAMHKLSVQVHYRACAVDGPTAQGPRMPNEQEPASRRLQ